MNIVKLRVTLDFLHFKKNLNGLSNPFFVVVIFNKEIKLKFVLFEVEGQCDVEADCCLLKFIQSQSILLVLRSNESTVTNDL